MFAIVKLKVTNIAEKTGIEALRETFAICGTIVSIEIIHENQEKISFLHFNNQSSIDNALALKKVELDGRVLQLYDARSINT